MLTQVTNYVSREYLTAPSSKSTGGRTEDGLLLESVIPECLRWLTGFGTSRITIRMSYCGSLTIVDFRTRKSGASLLRLVHTRWRRSRRPRCVRYCKLFPKGEVRLWMEQYRSAWMLLERRLQYRIRSGGQRCDLYLMLPCRMPSTPCRTRLSPAAQWRHWPCSAPT